MRTSLNTEQLETLLAPLSRSNQKIQDRLCSWSWAPQPLHTYFLSAADVTEGALEEAQNAAIQCMQQHGGDYETFAHAIGLPLSKEQSAQNFAQQIHRRVVNKLETQPFEDLRFDFAALYPTRSDAEEDADALRIAELLTERTAEQPWPPKFGIRVKPLHAASAARSLRTIDLFLTHCLEYAQTLPNNLVITLAHVQIPEQVQALNAALAMFEAQHQLAPNSIALEIQLDSAEALVAFDGSISLRHLWAAARQRCNTIRLGEIALPTGRPYPAPDDVLQSSQEFLRYWVQLGLQGTGTILADAPLPAPTDHNISAWWQTQGTAILSRLRAGWTQGTDWHPSHLPIRFATNFVHYSFGWRAVATQMQSLRCQPQPSVDAIMACVYFLQQAWLCGAVQNQEFRKLGLTEAELPFLAL